MQCGKARKTTKSSFVIIIIFLYKSFRMKFKVQFYVNKWRVGTANKRACFKKRFSIKGNSLMHC